ncbi:RNA 2',3'-cyclic phosphodiesterase [Gorillibacterium sp. sgz5001074]|uniref:RNA 2',3'-cyclic phosphodiesterase n=1 Tax=Gorillibacterium sp. sgz5001074 TaxID=3446695 RepID=UPI003F672333
MSGSTYRLFTAVPLPAEIKKSLAEWTRAHKALYPFQKWAHTEDLHITLYFMGDTEEERLPRIMASLEEAVSLHVPFKLRLSGLGTFGPPAAPSILWTGLEGDRDRLVSLQRDVLQALVRVGYSKEDKPFRPHITLARRYQGDRPWTQVRSKLPEPAGLDGLEWTSGSVILYRSHLGRSPMYEVVKEFRLPVLSAT